MCVSVLIFTFNEAVNLPACLESVSWCDDVIVIDSFSTDKTEKVCAEYNARFIQHEFSSMAQQRNWALEEVDIKNEWVLILDADERVTDEVRVELCDIARNAHGNVGAYRIRRRFYMWGRWLKYSSLYPTWIVRFFHKDRVRYVDRGHGETEIVKGEIGNLNNDLLDENLKGIEEWYARQNRYSTEEAFYELDLSFPEKKLLASLFGGGDERRAALKYMSAQIPFRGLVYFLYSYIWRKGFLDGRDGFIFCLMRSQYQSMVAIKKYDSRRSLKR